MSGRDDLGAPPALGTALQLMGVERAGVPGGGGAALNGGTPPAASVAPPERPDEPPRKRPKLPADDAAALRRRILECELLRLRTLRDRFTEQLSELYFLQAGGNMMDYAVWRKRPPAPQLLAFLEARRPPAVGAAPAPPGAQAVQAAPAAVQAPADEMVEKAKQEAYVAARVAELARAGLWAERRLPRVLEPPRPKAHWDYLLEEMAWLAQDFAHERKWKKQAAKKCARAVQKYFQDKAAAAQKAEKAQELQLKKIAAFAAREIRTFWSNVEKLVEWKRVRRVERARKEALDEQLSYIVDRTERYSRQLAANLHAPASVSATSAPPSDDEFQPRDASDDDEETIAAAEREATHEPGELEALARDSRLALRELLPPGYLASPPASDYGPDAASDDDERTIAAQERRERADHAAELAALRRDADLDVDELRRRYAAPPPARSASASDDDDDDSDERSGDDSDDSASDSTAASDALEALMEGAAAEGEGAGAEGRVEAAASLAASLQPTGTTLSETQVGTPVPSLLRGALREYQHVGLHWLATMHARGLNGILADEMGLGKTVQSIALLAHLAERRDWGPHLVVAPTSVVQNWEMEFKKWCPAFKILTYYGTIKERKMKRVGWTKANSFHVCITSYKLVVQDHQSFRRKRWKYLILDEAQNIKNFKSQRWQLLLNFQTERRLLLTGTPLQNSLLELWSLMHFLMPDEFASHSEFREWFAELGAEGANNEALARRLHGVLRPFLLRRLKRDVERQMPRKYEHVLLCRLAARQRYLYDDFMARAKTRESLSSGNLLSVINVLMQLRKVCNHPDLFEPRPVQSPLALAALRYVVPALALGAGVAERDARAARLGGDLASLELSGAHAFAAHRARHLAPPRRLVEEQAERRRRTAPPRPPPAELRLHLRLVPRAPPRPAQLPPPPPPRWPGGAAGGAAARGRAAAGGAERAALLAPAAVGRRPARGRARGPAAAPGARDGRRAAGAAGPHRQVLRVLGGGARGRAAAGGGRRRRGARVAAARLAARGRRGSGVRARGAGAAARAGRAPGRGVPAPVAAAVRLRQAADAGRAAAAPEGGRPPRADLHADDARAGRAGGLPVAARPRLPAPGRRHARGPAPAARGALQRGRARVRLHPVHAQRRRGTQPHGRRLRGVLRLGLEPHHGRAGAGPLPPHRPDARRARVPPRHRQHRGGKHPAQGRAEARARHARHRGRPLHHVLPARVEYQGAVRRRGAGGRRGGRGRGGRGRGAGERAGGGGGRGGRGGRQRRARRGAGRAGRVRRDAAARRRAAPRAAAAAGRPGRAYEPAVADREVRDAAGGEQRGGHGGRALGAGRDGAPAARVGGGAAAAAARRRAAGGGGEGAEGGVAPADVRARRGARQGVGVRLGQSRANAGLVPAHAARRRRRRVLRQLGARALPPRRRARRAAARRQPPRAAPQGGAPRPARAAPAARAAVAVRARRAPRARAPAPRTLRAARRARLGRRRGRGAASRAAPAAPADRAARRARAQLGLGRRRGGRRGARLPLAARLSRAPRRASRPRARAPPPPPPARRAPPSRRRAAPAAGAAGRAARRRRAPPRCARAPPRRAAPAQRAPRGAAGRARRGLRRAAHAHGGGRAARRAHRQGEAQGGAGGRGRAARRAAAAHRGGGGAGAGQGGRAAPRAPGARRASGGAGPAAVPPAGLPRAPPEDPAPGRRAARAGTRPAPCARHLTFD